MRIDIQVFLDCAHLVFLTSWQFFFYLISSVQYLDNKKEDEKENEEEDLDDDDITEKRRKFFSEKSNYSPETRVEMQKVLEEINREKENVGDVPKKEKKERKLFME